MNGEWPNVAFIGPLLAVLALTTVGSARAQSGGRQTPMSEPAPVQASSQRAGPAHRLWGSVGLGLGKLQKQEELVYFVGQLSAHRQRGHEVLSLRGTVATDLGEDGWADAGLLIGWGTTGGPVHASAGVGAAVTLVDAPDEVTTIGLPLEVQLSYGVSDIPVGVGIYAFANVNAEQNFGGITLSLHFGRL